MIARIPIVDLTQEILLHIDGESTKKHTISWDILRNVGDKLQALILTLAKYNLDEGDVTDLNNFKLEFIGFYDGSATPSFALNNSPTPTLYNVDNKIKENLNFDFSRIMYNVNKGNFQAIADSYNTSEVSNDVITKVYEFSNSAGSAPVQIVKRRPKGRGWAKVYDIRKLKKDVYDQLIIKPKTPELITKIPEETAVGKFIVKRTPTGKLSKKLSEIFMEKSAVLSIELEHIVTLERRYEFKSPILFKFDGNDSKGYIIENEQLDLFAAGKSLDEAKTHLYAQFDITYQTLTKMPDKKLSDRLIAVKQQYNFIVKNIQ